MNKLTDNQEKEIELELACGQLLDIKRNMDDLTGQLTEFKGDYSKLKKIIVDLMVRLDLKEAEIGKYRVFRNGDFLRIKNRGGL